MTPASCSPSVWGEAGTETITFSFEGTDVTCEVEGEAIAKALTSLAYSGTFGTQTVGSAPDLTGITFTAHYNDSTLDHTVSNSDITVSPATWAESGSQTLTMSYTDEYGTASTTATVTVEAAPASSKTITGISVSGTQTNDNFWYNRFRPYGLEFTISCSDGTTWTTANDDHDGETHDLRWSGIKHYDDTRESTENDCPIICECEADPDSYDSHSSYFWSTGSVTLTITPNPDYIDWPDQIDEISQSATTTLTVTVQNPLFVDGTIPAQTVGQAPDLGTAVIKMNTSNPSQSPSDVTNRCTLTPASWTTAGTDTLVATYTASSGPAGYNTCSVSESVTVEE